MLEMRFSEFQEKEVINACDCCKLGYVEDLVIDEKKGKIDLLGITISKCNPYSLEYIDAYCRFNDNSYNLS